MLNDKFKYVCFRCRFVSYWTPLRCWTTVISGVSHTRSSYAIQNLYSGSLKGSASWGSSSVKWQLKAGSGWGGRRSSRTVMSQRSILSSLECVFQYRLLQRACTVCSGLFLVPHCSFFQLWKADFVFQHQRGIQDSNQHTEVLIQLQVYNIHKVRWI